MTIEDKTEWNGTIIQILSRIHKTCDHESNTQVITVIHCAKES